MEVRISRLGARGDGIADTPDGPLYVSLTVPGDVAEVRPGKPRGDGRAAELLRIVAPGPDRRDAACRHFGACGGCALQHVADGAYRDWKRARVAEALRRQGLEAETGPAFAVPPGTRRRVRLAFRRIAAGMLLGFREGASNRIVDIAECPVARPEIVALLPALRAFLASHAAAGEVAVTVTDTGIDLAVYTDNEIGLDLRMDAPAFCEANGVARLSWGAPGEPTELLIALMPVRVRFGGVSAEPPPEAFLQPTSEGEAVLREFVLRAVGDADRIVDLYAGCGAFALSLSAAGKTVHAVEGLEAQTGAITRADPNISVETRDLARQPLRAEELSRFDAVVLDPPRAGAAEQAAQIAESGVPVVVYVSCNPGTFARDARTLAAAGYVLETVLPVDQFLWSPHVELASAFRRG